MPRKLPRPARRTPRPAREANRGMTFAEKDDLHRPERRKENASTTATKPSASRKQQQARLLIWLSCLAGAAAPLSAERVHPVWTLPYLCEQNVRREEREEEYRNHPRFSVKNSRVHFPAQVARENNAVAHTSNSAATAPISSVVAAAPARTAAPATAASRSSPRASRAQSRTRPSAQTPGARC